MKKFLSLLQNIISNIFNKILPYNCMLCFTEIIYRGFCAACWKKFSFIINPCHKCGCAMKYSKTFICEKCYELPPENIHRSLIQYNKECKKIFMHIKYNDRGDIAEYIADVACVYMKNFITKYDVILPVPLHKYRFLQRKYNQADVIGRRIAKNLNISYEQNILYRKIYTIPQGSMSKKDRSKNVENVFEMRNHFILKNKKILLIDDVCASGSTLKECCKILKNSGAKEISSLTIAKTN